jgi:Dyp-type peroxidase family
MPNPRLVPKLENIQGNSLGGFNKDHQSNLFLKFTNDADGRAWVKEISAEVAASSSAAVVRFNNQFSTLRAQGVTNPETLISAVWVNLVLSWQGLKALKINQAGLDAFPADFKGGMHSRSVKIGDAGESAPDKWIVPFKQPDDVHALLIVAADSSSALEQKVNDISGTAAFAKGVKLLLNQAGNTRPDLPGHEHFGFKDGISQPGVRGVDPPDDPTGNPNQGHPGQDLLWPGEFILGYATQIPAVKVGDDGQNVDGPNPDPGPDSKSGPVSLTADGSYLVFRRLAQNVPAFNQEISRLAEKLAWSHDLTGAKLVGRYKSGAPIEQRKFQPGPYTPPSKDPGNPIIGNPALGNNNAVNNNFEFGDDPQGRICPAGAHIRKAYPRDELTTPEKPDDSESDTQTHRLLRRGIPYGAPFVPHDPASADVERGLLFLCYQNSIESHFEFVQKSWVNDPGFPPKADGTPDSPKLTEDAGQDPIIAQSPKAKFLVAPAENVEVKHFVTTTGGEYFFSPSISVLQDIGDNKH